MYRTWTVATSGEKTREKKKENPETETQQTQSKHTLSPDTLPLHILYPSLSLSHSINILSKTQPTMVLLSHPSLAPL